MRIRRFVKMGDVLELNEVQFDALREIGNIGAAYASNALGQMIGKNVIIDVPRTVYPIPVEEIHGVFGKVDDVIVMLHFKILGDTKGSIVISFTEDQAMLISNILLGKEDSELVLNEDRESALKEVGNILASSYLTALSSLVGFNLMPSIPRIAHDMTGIVLQPLIVELDQTVDFALVTDTKFLFEKKEVAGKCVTFFGGDSFTSILKALGIDEQCNP
jgi:chemotaxis protein CheC